VNYSCCHETTVAFSLACTNETRGELDYTCQLVGFGANSRCGRTKTIDPSSTGLRPIFRYRGTKIKLPNPKAKFGYEIKSLAFVGEILNNSEYRPMYTDGPKRAVLPKNEYKLKTTKINDFLMFDHWRGSFGFASGTG